ncbi:MAG: FCSD flavin-binding domain-containing protein [Pseudomonadota bacterium]
MTLDRRDFLRGLGGLLAVTATPALGRARPRVVVVGAGYGGATCARYLKRWAPAVEVTLIEPNPRFISCPMSNTVLAGWNRLDDLSFAYTDLAKTVDRFVPDRVTAIDPDRRRVMTVGGHAFDYDRLVLSPGVELMFERIAGYDANAQATVKHAWQAGPEQTGVLRRQLEAMPDGGVFVIGIPMAPFRCPPAPYERICLVADYLKRAKPRSKIVVLDGNDDIIAKKDLFLAAWSRHYGFGTEASLIDYRPANIVTELDLGLRTVRSEFDAVQGDVLNLIPPMRAAALTGAVGARTGDDGHWCPVDYTSFESSVVPHIHILGDAILSNLSKAAALANNGGKLCAYALSEIFAGRAPDPAPVLTSTCYSASARDAAFHVATVFRYNPAERSMDVQPGSGLSERESAEEFKYMRGWARNIWADTLALPDGYSFSNAV